ncbi:hypothetical protein CAPTEDRAFT_212935 [Capitella teleta]|uniref:Uncharacterized protein n=1 Tax=Capitella teleta TaxID=283909 RepID=R7URH3_CAPTE|nr:hypothetical protein CAPTEDRAFT_212935 [Capitella teleta]|eukprot:ELU08738.1 hypothetical protein CAPTEDRAFT_212935 [Capitella teleta]
MGRQIRNTLPTLPKNLQPAWPADDIVHLRDGERKEKAKNYYDAKHGATPLPVLQRGQRVFVADRKEPGVVVGADDMPRSVLVQVGNRTIRRNRHDLRLLPAECNSGRAVADLPSSTLPDTSSLAILDHRSSIGDPAVAPNPCVVPSRAMESSSVPVPCDSPSCSNSVHVPSGVSPSYPPTPLPSSTPVHTRSGRQIRPPERLDL